MLPYRGGENSGTSSGILIMHPFDRSEALQPGKEEMQGIISGVVRLKTFVENFLKVGAGVHASNRMKHYVKQLRD